LKNKTNETLEREGTFHIMNALKFYTDKYNYKSKDITFIDIGAKIGWYTIFFGLLNYSILSFEPIPENNYILKKNFCKNKINCFGISPLITIINETLYPNETYCDYFKEIGNIQKYLILCDKTKEKNLKKKFIKIGKVKTTKLTTFLPFITDKRIALLKLDLVYEGGFILQSLKKFILKYHIPFILIEVNTIIFRIHEMKPKDLFEFFIKNGYRISLNGFIDKQFISIDEIMKANLVNFNLYLVYEYKIN
jgi:FkbM family methyltransferase